MTVETRPIEAPPAEKSVADVLRHAARIIEERGWSDDEPVTADGRCCALGAIRLAVHGRIGSLETRESRPAILYFGLGLDPADAENAAGTIAEWNDTEASGAAEVTAALRAAADKWEAEHAHS